jgi:probable rRNA maturation factor
MSFTIENQLTHFNETALPLEQAFQITEKSIEHKLNVTLLFVSLDEMFNLNNRLRQKSTPTDILSLPDSQDSGEVFICPDYIFSQGYSNDRITHLWVHGLLHLSGFTHDGQSDFKIMREHETNICLELGIKDPYAETPD